jgi:hypothetical protein
VRAQSVAIARDDLPVPFESGPKSLFDPGEIKQA